ncbi:MAG: hypothetical protein AUK35_06330 [Zetaproteobacteria bacterium CG2_30_46_52]|nr:MAG: hypothetical protein AUK35_06330 [Zetaproteobacteria bacterium CG2_30_46_52]
MFTRSPHARFKTDPDPQAQIKLLQEVPRAQRFISRRSLDDLSANDVARGKWMTEVYKEHGYTMAEIAKYAGVHYSLVNKIIKNWSGDDSRFKT